MPTANQCKDFVECVLNGDYKDSAAAIRNRFARLYRDWFPPEPDGPNKDEYVRVMLLTSEVPQLKWCSDSIQQDHPQNFFEWRVAELRDRLRFIWVADREAARHGVRMLVAETLDFWREGDRIEPWRERQFAVCDWLEKWLTARKGSRLLVCKNPECEERRYFVRESNEPNKKYCSSPCAAMVEELKRLARRKQRQRRVLSASALAAIRKGQQQRRERERMSARKKVTQRNEMAKSEDVDKARTHIIPGHSKRRKRRKSLTERSPARPDRS